MLCGYFTAHLHTGHTKYLVFSSIWPGVQEWTTSFKLSCLFLRKLCMPPFMCTIKCRAINALQEKLSRNVCHYPHLRKLSYLPCLYDDRDFNNPLIVYTLQFSSFKSFSQARWETCLAVRGTKKQEKTYDKIKNSNILRKNTTNNL